MVDVGVAPPRRRRFDSGWSGADARRAKLASILSIFADSHGLAAKSFVARARRLQNSLSAKWMDALDAQPQTQPPIGAVRQAGQARL